MSDYAISVQNISKIYKLYDKPIDRLKDALGLSRAKRYREHYALHDVSFDVKKGETVGIIGTNGSGKSTILKIITGVLSPTAGNLVIDGRISALLELGAGFNMEYTGIENVYLNGTMIGFSRKEIDDKLQDILDFADIGDFVNQPVKTYSSGMFVRLAFAVAININPEILIVDEALSVGDVFFQNKCFHKFEEFKKLGKTILFVSHDLTSISKYCDRVILLNRGEMLAEGTPKEMVGMYKRLLVGVGVDQLLKEKGKEAEAVDGIQAEAADGAQDKDCELDLSGNATVDSCFGNWRSHFAVNPTIDCYGNGKAEIVDFAIVDEDGLLTSTITKGSRFSIKSRVRFNEMVADPIFTFTFKNAKGDDITGTNTMYEKVVVDVANPGDEYIATFTQDMNLQGGNYLLSISCTGFENGELQAYQRLYDLLNITVVSDKNTVGFYDMNSKVTVEKVSG